jgi:Tol biopolymer transport system component
VIRYTFSLLTLVLILLSSGLAYARQEPSTASWILFEILRDNQWEFYRIRPDGKSMQHLVHHGHNPSWSPDGQYLTYGNHGDIFVLDSGGGEPVQLTDRTIQAERAHWSSDGQWIAFEVQDASSREIYRIRPDGSDLTRLTVNDASDCCIRWEGDDIYFLSNRDNYSMAVFRMNADGTEQQPVVDDWRVYEMNIQETQDRFRPGSLGIQPSNPYIRAAPEVVRIDEWVVFQEVTGANWDLFRMRGDGSQRQQLTKDGGVDCCVTWSPVGDALVFMSNRSGNGDLYYLEPRKGRPRQLTDTVDSDCCAVWSPIIDMSYNPFMLILSGIMAATTGYVMRSRRET